MRVLRNIVSDFRINPDDVPRIEQALFFDGPNQRMNLERFGTLMFFATMIATYGVIADSTATVIGAMLIAPLMTPILATAAAVVTGQMERAGRALLTVLAGMAGAVALSWGIGTIYHAGLISVSTNSQIVARTSPSLVDLYAALGAGAVGAFAVSRKDVSDTLPGAAIAIALVPPLAVVGLTLSQGAWEDALGALLLFMTNFFAILLTGGAILALLGLSAAVTSELRGYGRNRAFAVIILGTLLISIPLAATSLNTLNATRNKQSVQRTTEQWLDGTSYQLGDVRTSPGSALIRILGEGDLPDTQALVASLEENVTRETSIRLEVIPESVHELSASPAGGTE